MIAVVIPCYKVKSHILDVIKSIGNEVERIYVVDDKCPENSGLFVADNCTDSRVHVLYNEVNLGVGGAVKQGYQQAIVDNVSIIVKIDGDGQMDSSFIKTLIAPIKNGQADYCKGNRFFDLETLLVMPKMRLFGNSVLSLFSKIMSGYWNIVDPTNGYTAIHIDALKMLPLHKLDNRYFFESDMLFRLSIIRAVVKDVAIPAKYGNEISNLKINKILFSFLVKYTNRFYKRIFYNYLLRDFNVGSIQLFFGTILFVVGVCFGIYQWEVSLKTLIVRSSGTVMISALLVILGFQLLLSALNYDVHNVPNEPIQKNKALN